jgi:hypothetical protein
MKWKPASMRELAIIMEATTVDSFQYSRARERER